MGHLGVVLYEYLGEEYPEVLGSILGALKVGIVISIAYNPAEFLRERQTGLENVRQRDCQEIFSTNSLQEIVAVCQEIFSVKSPLLDINMNSKFMLLFFYGTLFSCDICILYNFCFALLTKNKEQKTEIAIQNTAIWYYQRLLYQISCN